MSKHRAVGMAQSPVAHARDSTSRFAKAGANIENPFTARFDRVSIVKTVDFNWSRVDSLSRNGNSALAAQFITITERSRP
jgi:hypothetical protein